MSSTQGRDDDASKHGTEPIKALQEKSRDTAIVKIISMNHEHIYIYIYVFLTIAARGDVRHLYVASGERAGEYYAPLSSVELVGLRQTAPVS